MSFYSNEDFALSKISVTNMFYLMFALLSWPFSVGRIRCNILNTPLSKSLMTLGGLVGVQDYILNTFVFLEFRIIILLLLLLLLLLLPLFAFTVSQKLLHGLIWNFIYILTNYKCVADRNIVDLDQWPWPLQLETHFYYLGLYLKIFSVECLQIFRQDS